MTAAEEFFILRLSLGTVCLWAGMSKAVRPAVFSAGVASYRLVPPHLARRIGFGLLAAEIGSGIALIAGWPHAAGPAAATALFALFTGAIAINLARRNRVPCNCFGESETELISAATLVRALLLTGAGAVTWALALRQPPLPERGAILPAVTIAGAIIVTTRVIGAFPQTWASLRAAPYIAPHPTNRLSFKDQPLERSLRMPLPGHGAARPLPLQVEGLRAKTRGGSAE